MELAGLEPATSSVRSRSNRCHWSPSASDSALGGHFASIAFATATSTSSVPEKRPAWCSEASPVAANTSVGADTARLRRMARTLAARGSPGVGSGSVSVRERRPPPPPSGKTDPASSLPVERASGCLPSCACRRSWTSPTTMTAPMLGECRCQQDMRPCLRTVAASCCWMTAALPACFMSPGAATFAASWYMGV